MILLTVPLALLLICGVLALAAHLEERRAGVAVRMSMRNRATSPEECEALAAAELAPVLAARGLLNRAA